MSHVSILCAKCTEAHEAELYRPCLAHKVRSAQIRNYTLELKTIKQNSTDTLTRSRGYAYFKNPRQFQIRAVR